MTVLQSLRNSKNFKNLVVLTCRSPSDQETQCQMRLPLLLLLVQARPSRLQLAQDPMQSVLDVFALSVVALERKPMSSKVFTALPELAHGTHCCASILSSYRPCSHDATFRTDEMLVNVRVAPNPDATQPFSVRG